MATRKEFLTKLKVRGATADQMARALKERREKIGAFDDDPGAEEVTAKAKAPDVPEEKRGLLQKAGDVYWGAMGAAERALMPSVAEMPTTTFKEGLTKGMHAIGTGVLETLAAPVRAAGMLRKDPKTGERYKISDPQSAIFRPEMERAKTAIEGDLPPASMLDEVGQKIGKAGVELLGNIASDPVAWLALGKTILKGGAALVKKAGVGIPPKTRPLSTGEKLLPSVAPKKKGLEKIFSRIDEADRSILSEPLSPLDTPFDDYAAAAKAAMENPRNPTPLDIAGRKAVKALDDIVKKRQGVGAKKGGMIDEYGEEIIDISDVKDQWKKLLRERLNATVEKGKIKNVFDPKRPIKRQSEMPMLEQINSYLDKLDDEVFIIEADDIKGAISDIVNNYKAGQARPQNTVTEGIGKAIAKTIDDKLDDILGPEFDKVNRQYGDLKDIEMFLNRKLGTLVDVGGGEMQAERGASLLKAVLQSNSDRNTRALFAQIKEHTGIDLVKDAKFGEIAMRSVDDPRIRGLLEEVGSIRRLMGGKAGLVASVAGDVGGRLRPSKIDEVLKFAEKQAASRMDKPFNIPIPFSGIAGGVTRVINPEEEKQRRKIMESMGKQLIVGQR